MRHFVISALSAVAYGGTTYFRNLLPALAAEDGVNRYTVLVKPAHLEEMRVAGENFRFVAVPACSGSAVKRMGWEQAVLPGWLARWNADVAYTANNVGLLRSRVPTVTAVRNLEPFFYGDYEDGRRARARNRLLLWLTGESVRRATLVIAVSEYVRDVVARRFGAEGKVRVIRHGRPTVVPDEAGAAALRRKHGLSGEYFLANGKFVPYGNLHNLVRGYGLALHGNPHLPPLVLAGGGASPSYKRTVLEVVQSGGLAKRVVFAGLVPHAANLALMRTARLFLFPTLLEACPNTLIEAMAMGCLVASSDRGPMREIAGESVLYFDAADPGAIAAGILEAYALPDEETARLRSSAERRSLAFDWRESARRLAAVLDEAAG